MKRFRYISLVWALLISVSSYSKDLTLSGNEMERTLNHMFEKVDFSLIPTGLLRDYAVEEEDLDLFTGTSELNSDNCVTGMKFLNLINTVNSLDRDRKVLAYINSSVRSYQYQSNEVPVCVLLYKYSQIKSNALTESLISYKNEQVSLLKKGPSPFEQQFVFAACGLKRKFDTRNVVLTFPKDLANTNCSIKEYRIDYGQGYQQAQIDDKMPISLVNGQNIIKVVVELTNGIILKSHFIIYLEQRDEELEINRIGSIQPIKTISITGDPYKGITTSATVSIMYGYSNGMRHNRLTRPFIFVEGFDPRFIDTKNLGSWNLDRLMREADVENLLYSGFDIVYVDWDKSEECIQANANTLINVINYINREKTKTLIDINNVIMGHSMGGLIARYALREMEKSSIIHGVTHYISYDTPHLGAQIPLGVLYGFYGIKKFIESRGLLTLMIDLFADIDIPDLIRLGESIAYSNAAKQMLVQYVDQTGNINNAEHLTWQRELNALGMPKGDPGFPMKLYAIAHGSYVTPSTVDKYLYTNFEAGTHLLSLPNPIAILLGWSLNDVMTCLLSCIPGRSTLEGEVGIYPAYKYTDKVTDISLKYKKKLAWLIPISHTIYEYSKTASPGPRYENFPSSTYNLDEDMIKHDSGTYDFGWLGWAEYGYEVADKIPFIPTSSALAIGDGISINSSDYLNKPSIGKSAFGENYYVTPSAISHNNLDKDALGKALSVINTEIQGPAIGKSGSIYSLKNDIAQWSSSDTSIATINSNTGELTAKGQGIVSIIAETASQTFSKEIMVGIPRFLLKGQHVPGGFNVTAECTEKVYKEDIDNLFGSIIYRWGVKLRNRDIIWENKYDRDFIIPLGLSKESLAVYFQMMDSEGNFTPIYSIRCKIDDIYKANNDLFYIDATGNLYNKNKSKLHYEVTSIYLEYLDGIDELYKDRKWMATSTEICGIDMDTHNAYLSSFRLSFKDMMTEDDFNFIKSSSEDDQTYTYLLVLRNSAGQPIQVLPITIVYKDKI